MSFAAAYFLFSTSLWAKLWIIDDHNILNFYVNKEKAFGLSELLHLFVSDNSYKFIENERFRPGFQIAFPLEVLFFQLNSQYYKFFSLIIYIVFIAETSVIFYLYSKNYLLSIIVLLITSTQMYWVDILNRIITMELWSIVGIIFYIPIVLINIKLINKNNSIGFWNSIIYLISGILSITSKESMLFLAAIPLFFLFFYKDKTRLNIFFQFCNILLLILSLIVIFRIVDYLISANNLQASASFDYSRYAISFIKIYFFKFFGLYTLVPIYFWNKSQNKSYDELFVYLTSSLLLIGLVAFQVIIYSGGIPSSTRYDFPVLFFIVFYLYVLNKYVSCFAAVRLKNILLFFYIAVYLLINNPLKSIEAARTYSYSHVIETIRFSSKLNQALKVLEALPSPRVVVHVESVWDYEYISSLYKYLAFNISDLLIYLDLNNLKISNLTEVERIFYRRLQKVASGAPDFQKDGMDRREWGYKDISGFDKKNKECIEIYMTSTSEVRNWCKYSVYFPLR